MIKGVFFDIGGTLYSYRKMPAAMKELLQMTARKLELEYDFDELARHYQLASRETDKEFSEKSFFLGRDYIGDIFTRFLDRIGKKHLQSHLAWFEENQRDLFIRSMEIMPDCHETLTRLKAMGLYLSAVSNADENHLQPLVERAELHRWLDHWTCSETAQSCKPDKRFFEIALQKSGLSADQVLFVGDSREQDIQGAHSVGMRTVLISETDQPAMMEVGRKTGALVSGVSRIGAAA